MALCMAQSCAFVQKIEGRGPILQVQDLRSTRGKTRIRIVRNDKHMNKDRVTHRQRATGSPRAPGPSLRRSLHVVESGNVHATSRDVHVSTGTGSEKRGVTKTRSAALNTTDTVHVPPSGCCSRCSPVTSSLFGIGYDSWRVCERAIVLYVSRWKYVYIDARLLAGNRFTKRKQSLVGCG